ncbi:MAG: ATP-binding protein [Alphaproteobacteria bacterium]
MRVKLPKKVDKTLRGLKLKFMPKTLFFRTMLIVFVPLILVQAISIVVFLDSNWGKVGRQFAYSVADDMSFIMNLENSNNKDVTKLAKDELNIIYKFYSNEEKHTVLNKASKENKLILKFLEEALDAKFPDASKNIYLDPDSKDMVVSVDNNSGLYLFEMKEGKIFKSSIFGFVAWMMGSSILLFIVAALFVRTQSRSIAELAQVAEDFGKGVDRKGFKPYGSKEVRQAAIAFIKMKERIQKQISERTQMLAGVSHDLRTPLARMRLSVEMAVKGNEQKEFIDDIDEMEKMLEGYLSFVSGEGGEINGLVDLNETIVSIINKSRETNALIKYSTSEDIKPIVGREQALKRAITNILTNAFRYGKTVSVKLKKHGFKMVDIIVEDDGPGIPADKREDVFKAFYRIEDSRNKETGGVGLGMSIAKDIITSHGGDIELSDSKDLGGLKVVISIPK